MGDEEPVFKILTDGDIKKLLQEEGIDDDIERYDGLFHVNHDIYTHVYHCSMLMKIEHLDLGHNKIVCSKGLEFCDNMITLNLENNKLKSMKHVGAMKFLKVLNMRNNKITALEYLGNAPDLEVLDLSGNRIGCKGMGSSALYNLMHNYKLKYLNLQNNEIDEEVLGDFVQFPGLRELVFTPNPVIEHYPAYRATFVFFLTQIEKLDGVNITDFEYKIASVRVWKGPEAAEKERIRLEKLLRGETEEGLFSKALYVVTAPFRIISMLLNPVKLIRWVCNSFTR